MTETPGMSMIKINGSDIRFPAHPEDTVLQAALRAGVAWPYECSVGACGMCKFIPTRGEVDLLRDDAPGLSARDAQRGRRLGCQCKALSDLEITVHLEAGPEAAATLSIPPRRISAHLVDVTAISRDIRAYRFQSVEPAHFFAGQYALLTLDGVEGIRAYSMSNTANEKGVWEFMIRHVEGGQASRALNRIYAGTTITLDGPYGVAHLRPLDPHASRADASRDIVCIAGGSGLAPMLSIARANAESTASVRRNLHFFYGARTPVDACSQALISVLPGYGISLRCTEAVSSDPTKRWDGPIGPIHEIAARQLEGPLSRYEFYLSGPAPMITASVTALVREQGVPRTQIHFDRFF